MINYVLRRLLLLPITLFSIILVNFVIINFAPGDPISITDVTSGGAVRSDKSGGASTADNRYLQFRQRYGLTLPVLLNTWVFFDEKEVEDQLKQLLDNNENNLKGMSLKKIDALRIATGDMSPFVMEKLLNIMNKNQDNRPLLNIASRYFVRGGTLISNVSPFLSDQEKLKNREISENNLFLLNNKILPDDDQKTALEKLANLNQWYLKNKEGYHFELTERDKFTHLFFKTRFFKYMKSVLTLDFGTMRNDSNKLVIDEVVKRFKYSLTLSIIPMLLTLVLCQIFGFWMAYSHKKLSDILLNLIFLILFATPVFVAAPFLIEKVALYHNFPWTNIPIPISGFTSPERLFAKMTSFERLIDILKHIALPLVAVMYGGLAAETRLSRTAVLETLRQDYVRTAKAKGLSTFQVMSKHVGKNAAITIVTSIAGSLGVVLGGSLIVETMFGIDGFGKFFYDGVINRDYNVILFSALAGSFLTLVGYLVADLCYMWLDPRVRLE